MIKIIRTVAVPISFDLLKGQLRYLNEYFEVVALSTHNEKLVEVGNREGVRIVGVNIERRISVFKDLASLIKLYRVFKREKPYIVHSITPKAGLITMLAGKMAGVPIRMHTFTGLIFPTQTGLMQKILIKMEQLLCWASTSVYPEGEGVKQDLINYRITSKPLKIIGNGNINGIDLDYFNPENISDESIFNLRNSLSIEDNDYVFLFVGRIVADKGVNELVSAFIEVYNQDNIKTKPHLVIVGDHERELDPLLPETYDIINNHNNIHAVGFKESVIDYFAIADMLVFPSYREGFPNVVLEAGAMRLNTIVSDVNGCNEIITNGENGWIVPPKNVVQLKERMVWGINNREESIVMGQKSRTIIKQKYEQSYVWGEMLKEYQIQLESNVNILKNNNI